MSSQVKGQVLAGGPLVDTDDASGGYREEVVVAGKTKAVNTALTVTASSAYASGNVIGALMTIAGASRAAGMGGLVQSAVAPCKSAQTGAVDIIYFNANPSSSTFTDKQALAVNAADIGKIIGVAHVTDWTSLGTPSIGQAQNLAMPFSLPDGTTLYAVAVARSTPTYGSTSDLSVTHRILQD